MGLKINESLTKQIDANNCVVVVDGDSLMDFEDRQASNMAHMEAAGKGWTGPSAGLREKPRPYSIDAATGNALDMGTDIKAAANIKVLCFRAEFRFSSGAGM